MKAVRLPAFFLAVVALGLACGPRSDEARLRIFLKETVALAEKKDLAGVMARLADNYLDFEGRDKRGTENLLRGYFRRTGIVIHILGTRIGAVDADGQASLQAEVLLSSGAAEVFRKLINFAAEYYRFDLRFRRAPATGWLIVSAGWGSVPLAELFPESLSILKNYFRRFNVE
jgi:hypothetical protein